MSLQMRRNLHVGSALLECTCISIIDGPTLAVLKGNITKCNALTPMHDMPRRVRITPAHPVFAETR
jgi:hypothetical protein